MYGPIPSPPRPDVSTDAGACVWEGCGLVQSCSPSPWHGLASQSPAQGASSTWVRQEHGQMAPARSQWKSVRNWLSQQWVKWQGGKKCPIYLTTFLLCQVVISYPWHIGWESGDLLYLAAFVWREGWVSVWTFTKYSEVWEENCSVWGGSLPSSSLCGKWSWSVQIISLLSFLTWPYCDLKTLKQLIMFDKRENVSNIKLEDTNWHIYNIIITSIILRLAI